MGRLIKYIEIFLLAIGLSHPVLAQSDMYKVERVPVSSVTFNEIAPVIIKDGIMFCSDRRVSSITNTTTYKDERLFNLYIATRKDSSRWSSPKEITSKGSQLISYGPMSIASDNKTVYFTSNTISGKAARKKGINNPSGIFVGELTGTELSNIVPFKYNSPLYRLRYPSISRDGKYLFFASDMPGGQGGFDLYYCENINGQWAAPVNLGKKVNSSSNEGFPYIHPSGRLYFSSDRPGNADYLGGMDVYFTSLIYGEWDTPQAMPEPINSKTDDFAFVAEDSYKSGYFSRASTPGGNAHIFSFSSNMIRMAKCDSLKINSYTYKFEEVNAIRYDTMMVPFKYTWNFGDGTTGEGKTMLHTYKGPGKYTYWLDVKNLITNKVETNKKIDTLYITDIEQPYIASVDRCNTGQQIKLSADSTNLPGWTINQFYWNFGDESIQIGKNVNHAFSRSGIYNVQLIVTGTKEGSGIIREACVFKNISVIR
jgi:hypothetical protein